MLGSKLLSPPWLTTIEYTTIDIAKVGWLEDHCYGTDIVFLLSKYVAITNKVAY
jgi:hypothetical protein